jgi:hypothetical protein
MMHTIKVVIDKVNVKYLQSVISDDMMHKNGTHSATDLCQAEPSATCLMIRDPFKQIAVKFSG